MIEAMACLWKYGSLLYDEHLASCKSKNSRRKSSHSGDHVIVTDIKVICKNIIWMK